jgi:hypothetical protein
MFVERDKIMVKKFNGVSEVFKYNFPASVVVFLVALPFAWVLPWPRGHLL